jgi:hypothetical protein
MSTLSLNEDLPFLRFFFVGGDEIVFAGSGSWGQCGGALRHDFRARMTWQANREGCPLPKLALEADRSPMGFHDAFADRQTQATSSYFAAAGAIHAIEPLKKMRLIFGRNSHAGVRDCQDCVVLVARYLKVHVSAIVVVAHAICEQVCDDLCDARGVGGYLHGL